MNDSKFLAYRPSQLAACAVIIAVNIYKRDYEILHQDGIFSNDVSKQEKSFFKFSTNKCPETNKNLIVFNIDFWEGSNIVKLSGYTISSLI